MHQQLPQIALLRRRYPDAREPPRARQIQPMLGIARVRLLLAHLTGPNARRVPYPQLVPCGQGKAADLYFRSAALLF